ncbi:MAG: hypothetical protein ABJB66_16180, partial [Gemmatimonadaceae bacterium]
MNRSLVALATLTGISAFSFLACTPDYPAAPPIRATIEAIAWPDTLTDLDTTTLEVRITTEKGDVVTGTAVQWSSSDP